MTPYPNAHFFRTWKKTINMRGKIRRWGDFDPRWRDFFLLPSLRCWNPVNVHMSTIIMVSIL